MDKDLRKKLGAQFSEKEAELFKAVKNKKKKQVADKIKSMTIRRKMEEKQHDKGNLKPYETKGDEFKKYRDAAKSASPLLKAREKSEADKAKAAEEMKKKYKERKSGLRE